MSGWYINQNIPRVAVDFQLSLYGTQDISAGSEHNSVQSTSAGASQETPPLLGHSIGRGSGLLSSAAFHNKAVYRLKHEHKNFPNTDIQKSEEFS